VIRRHRTSTAAVPAFTLVELLATISVIFLIMGIALVAYTSASRTARAASDRAAVNGLQLAVGQFKAEFGFVPPLVKDLGPDGTGGQAFRVVRPDNEATSEGDDRGRYVPLVYSLASPVDSDVLRGREVNGERLRRYSLLSLPYYILGALDAEVDGVDGLGFYEVRRDGTFAPGGYFTGDLDPSASGAEVDSARRSQRRYEPFFDVGRGGVELANTTARGGTTGGSDGVLTRSRISWRFELRDRAGVAIRYYRWVKDEPELADVFRSPSRQNPLGQGISDIGAYADPEDAGGLDGEPGYYNVPFLVLNGLLDEPFESEAALNVAVAADLAFPFPAELRAATYAIVAAGPNQLFGDERGADGSDTLAALASDDALRRRYAERLGLSEARLEDDAGYRAEAIVLAQSDNIVEVGS
jgi:type II secretory pathway pseudopilin PulG